MKKMAFLLVTIVLATLTIESIVVAAEEDEQLQEEIIYNIVVDRYNNGDYSLDKQVRVDDPTAYQGGDLQGIIAKLDTFDELGSTTLTLSPIMENAPDGYHGYWIEDLFELEEQFGTMEDLNTLVEEAHKRDMKIVLEFVINYVSASHPLVTDPEKSDWFSESNDLTADWADGIVVLNQDNEEVEDYLIEAAAYWMEETNIDGFKLHAADQASESFLENFTTHIKGLDPDFYLLGDILDKDADTEHLKENTAIQAIDNNMLFESMNDVFSEAGNPVSDLYEAWEDNDQYGGLLYVDDKYTKRFTQAFAENGRNALTTWSLALTYMYTTPGVPSIFQGSEIPMYGADAEEAQRIVQFNSGDSDLKEFHNRISSLRANFPVLSYGDFEIVGSSGAMSVFKRTYEDETMYIAINNDEESQAVSVTGIDSGMQLRGYLGDNIVRENDRGEFKIGLAREKAEVFVIEPDTGLNWLFIGFVAGVFLLFIIVIFMLSRKQKKQSV
ncbi:alpha-amylase family glycosyl hydrolase [Virgibacillus sp. C22-A2]|uniref:Alpha-amylase family glycosyl hydrolase n=1 Tax=Virgibacillus tibetensis TaxID=3042313 RepID=A0ABU6KE92_9BACI|nr:alpha-amylase family glycosyl hydrolase [Virgibacillus sp. C22-A2]